MSGHLKWNGFQRAGFGLTSLGVALRKGAEGLGLITVLGDSQIGKCTGIGRHGQFPEPNVFPRLRKLLTPRVSRQGSLAFSVVASSGMPQPSAILTMRWKLAMTAAESMTPCDPMAALTASRASARSGSRPTAASANRNRTSPCSTPLSTSLRTVPLRSNAS